MDSTELGTNGGLSQKLRAKLQARIQEIGEYATAKELGLNHMTLIRAAFGLRLQPATRHYIASQLEKRVA
jgi:hypothetical protein